MLTLHFFASPATVALTPDELEEKIDSLLEMAAPAIEEVFTVLDAYGTLEAELKAAGKSVPMGASPVTCRPERPRCMESGHPSSAPVLAGLKIGAGTLRTDHAVALAARAVPEAGGSTPAAVRFEKQLRELQAGIDKLSTAIDALAPIDSPPEPEPAVDTPPGTSRHKAAQQRQHNKRWLGELEAAYEEMREMHTKHCLDFGASSGERPHHATQLAGVKAQLDTLASHVLSSPHGDAVASVASAAASAALAAEEAASAASALQRPPAGVALVADEAADLKQKMATLAQKMDCGLAAAEAQLQGVEEEQPAPSTADDTTARLQEEQAAAEAEWLASERADEEASKLPGQQSKHAEEQAAAAAAAAAAATAAKLGAEQAAAEAEWLASERADEKAAAMLAEQAAAKTLVEEQAAAATAAKLASERADEEAAAMLAEQAAAKTLVEEQAAAATAAKLAEANRKEKEKAEREAAEATAAAATAAKRAEEAAAAASAAKEETARAETVRLAKEKEAQAASVAAAAELEEEEGKAVIDEVNQSIKVRASA